MNTLLEKPRHVAMTSEEYHAHPAVGASMLETFRRSRREYHAKYIASEAPQGTSDALDFGTLVHLLMFEPERFDAEVAEPLPELAPDGKKWLRRVGSDHARWWDEELEKRNGKLCFDAADIERAKACVAAVNNHPVAKSLLGRKGMAEYSIFWNDAETGVACKCRVDWLSSVAIDLKTTCDATPEVYARQAVNLGYFRKRAHYLAGLTAYFGSNAPPFGHIVVESDKPHRVAVFRMEDQDSQGDSLGMYQRRSTLAKLKECMESGDWREPWEKEEVPLFPPAWAFKVGENQY